ncbi:MAG: hypothetical protein UX91_C0012G0010 [Candidatus Amesbacteria bacterium GW2011_GWB1_47_19]|nr:MAG: hypothetical protein UW51_C0011G0010 [Candidatus Amesbacteria bacterium GW2011_GWA1_44_24]KKU66499.1 MAG: hypothetical protein UX91_C0012G0010 [Candidatus Amesbacteria bacterium GW2011_GWB1_47_19]HBC73240.1 hypothetical protein [Candidatus Amesbacteria bacterium]
MKKQWFLVCSAVILLVLGAGGGCGVSAIKVMRGITENRPRDFKKWQGMFRWCAAGLPFVDRLPKWVDDKTYIVLLQNSTELRPSGGFAGSYVRVKFKDGGLADWTVQDIYVPDGKLPGHVEPPYPVQEAFRQGWWKLRDSNWDIDFASAAATVAWFFEQGGEEKVDGIIAVNLKLINQIVGVFGQVKVYSYDQTVTRENLYSLAQAEAEMDWEPGSTQKRDFLGAAGTALWERAKSAKPAEIFKLARIIKTELDRGEIMIWTKDAALEGEVKQWGWDGRWGEYYGDYLYMVETNLGANKANCCVQREIELEVKTEKDKIIDKLRIEWVNENPFKYSVKPFFWGGDYVDYVRIVVPGDAEVVSVSVSGEELRPVGVGDFAGPVSLRQKLSEGIWVEEERERYRIIGFWAVVSAGKKTEAVVEYILPKDEFIDRYRILVRHQPGMGSFPYKLNLNGKMVWEGRIEKSERIEAEIVDSKW